MIPQLFELPHKQSDPPAYWVEYHPIDSVFSWWIYERGSPKPIGKFATKEVAEHACEVLT